jgi:organic radical activating enzyme
LALHYEGYSENEALSISQSSSKHTDKGFYEVWNHIKNDKPNNITGGSLYHLATTYGNWKPKESDKKLPTNNVVHLTPKPQQKLLRKALSELFHEGLSGSILLAVQNDIADSYQKPLSNVQKLYQEIEKESEIKDSRYDNQLEIQALMTAKTQRISLNGLLPESLANGLNNRAELMNLRPECFLTSLLVGLSSVCNPTTQVTLNKNTDFAVNAGLYGGMVADSSQKKSPVQKTTILKPLFKIQAEYQEKYENKLKDYESDIERYEKLKKDKKSTQALYEEFPDGPPIKPTCENAITTDATGEALKSAIANQSIGTLFFSDELAGLFKSANQYRGGKGSDIEDMLSLYDGQGFNILRKTGSCFISNALLSIFGGIQPEILKGMLGNGKDSNGQWARFIWVEQPLIAGSMPRDGAGIDIDPMIEALYRQFLVHAKTQNFNHTYTLSREAFLIFADAYDEFESSRVAAGDSPMGSVYGKSEGRIGKLALILHLVKYLFTGDTVPNVIEADTVSNAIALTRFYIAQVQGLYGQLVPNGQSLAPQLFKIHKLALSKKEITARQVKQFTKITDTSEGIIQYFRELEAMGFGTIVSSGKTIKYRASAESAESVEDSSTHKEPIHSKDSRVSAESVEEISKFSKNLNPENSDFLNKESSTFSTLDAQKLVETEFGCAENFLHLSALDETQNSQPTTEQGLNQSADSFYTCDSFQVGDRGLVTGDFVTCEKFPGEVFHIGDISGGRAACLNSDRYEYIPLNELVLSV